MTDPDETRDKTLRELMSADLRDSLDEELGLEFSESQLEQFGGQSIERNTRTVRVLQGAISALGRAGEVAGLGPAQQASGRRSLRRASPLARAA